MTLEQGRSSSIGWRRGQARIVVVAVRRDVATIAILADHHVPIAHLVTDVSESSQAKSMPLGFDFGVAQFYSSL
jgi:hypothetical protein